MAASAAPIATFFRKASWLSQNWTDWINFSMIYKGNMYKITHTHTHTAGTLSCVYKLNRVTTKNQKFIPVLVSATWNTRIQIANSIVLNPVTFHLGTNYSQLMGDINLLVRVKDNLICFNCWIVCPCPFCRTIPFHSRTDLSTGIRKTMITAAVLLNASSFFSGDFFCMQKQRHISRSIPNNLWRLSFTSSVQTNGCISIISSFSNLGSNSLHLFMNKTQRS